MTIKFFNLVLLTFLMANGIGKSGETIIYFNDFNGDVGSSYPEWWSSIITYESNISPPGSGSLKAPAVTNVESPNHRQRFLGEFGGDAIGSSKDPGYNHTRVDQTVSLNLFRIPAHTTVTLSFDLYILKSWDGDSPMYGPDRWSISADGKTKFNNTFSNNPKFTTEGSYQAYPVASSFPGTGAVDSNTLGYSDYFKDHTYHFEITFAHSHENIKFDFRSSLFEGKGINDESWGLDNVKVAIK